MLVRRPFLAYVTVSSRSDLSPAVPSPEERGPRRRGLLLLLRGGGGGGGAGAGVLQEEEVGPAFKVAGVGAYSQTGQGNKMYKTGDGILRTSSET